MPQAARRFPGAGFYRFIPDEPGVLRAGGRLQMMAVTGRPGYLTARDQTVGATLPAHWVDIDDPDPPEAGSDHLAVFRQGVEQGAARFARLEGAFHGDGGIYVVSTNGGDATAGQVFHYRPASAETGELTLVFESPSHEVLDSPDNIVVSPRGGLVMCEDGTGDQFVRGLDREGRIVNLVWSPQAEGGPQPGEFAGSCFSPDGRVLFFNVQGSRRIEESEASATYGTVGAVGGRAAVKGADMGKDKLPRIPTFAELGISEDEVEELEREIAQEAAARRRREAGRGAPAEEDRAARAGARAAPGRSGRAHGAGLAGGRGAVPAPGAAVPDRAPAPAGPSSAQPDPSPGTEEPERTQEISPAERKRRARQARKAERKQKALAAREAKRALRGKRGGTAEQSVGPEPDPAPAPWGGLRGPLTLVVLLFTAWFSSSYRSLPAPRPGRRTRLGVFVGESHGSPSADRFGSAADGIARPWGGSGVSARGTSRTGARARPCRPPRRTWQVRRSPARPRFGTCLQGSPGRSPAGGRCWSLRTTTAAGLRWARATTAPEWSRSWKTLRVLRVRGPLLNDLIVLLTDGEELGLLGARAFVDEHPWLDDVALVVSIEMRGRRRTVDDVRDGRETTVGSSTPCDGRIRIRRQTRWATRSTGACPTTPTSLPSRRRANRGSTSRPWAGPTCITRSTTLPATSPRPPCSITESTPSPCCSTSGTRTWPTWTPRT